MPENEERLTEILHEWVVNPPIPPRFREQVWHRISSAEADAATPAWRRAIQLLVESIMRPKIACSYIAVLLACGVAAGAWTAQVQRDRTDTALGSRYVRSVDPYQFAHSSP
jgi:hypothetical protein